MILKMTKARFLMLWIIVYRRIDSMAKIALFLKIQRNRFTLLEMILNLLTTRIKFYIIVVKSWSYFFVNSVTTKGVTDLLQWDLKLSLKLSTLTI